jgi:hypothetical protein
MSNTACIEISREFRESSKPPSNATDYPISDRNDRIFAELVSPEDGMFPTDLRSSISGNDGTAPVTIDRGKECIAVPSLATLPTAPFSVNYHQLQLWEGRVDSVGTESFIATISDRTDPTLPDESVEISLDELGEVHRSRVKPGALFIWSIAYEDAGSGRRTISEVRFRRQRKWTKQSLKAVEETREFIESVLGSE